MKTKRTARLPLFYPRVIGSPPRLKLVLAGLVLWTCFPLRPSRAEQSGPQSAEKCFQLTEMLDRLARIKDKPRGELFEKYLLRPDGSVQPELLIFKDPATGREVWRFDCENSRHLPYYPVGFSAWTTNMGSQPKLAPGRDIDSGFLTRPARSPDSTKLFFASTALPTGHGACDCYLVVESRPAPPMELSAAPQGRGVRLAWKPHAPSREIKLYRIYRIKGDNYSFTPLAECPAGLPCYLDETLEAGSFYYYAVTSEEYSGLESDRLSPIIEVRVNPDSKLEIRTTRESGQGWDNITPEPPAGLTARKIEPGGYYLEWERSPAEDVRYYNLYYSPDGPSPVDQAHLIASLPKGVSAYFDWAARQDKKAHYTLIAVDRQDNLSEPALFAEP